MRREESRRDTQECVRHVMTQVLHAGRELKRIVREIAPKLRSLTDEQALAPYRPEGWSRKQILGHLIDSAANNHQRFVRGLAENPLTMPGYQQDAWVAANRYQSRDWAPLVDFWAAYNAHLYPFFANLPEEAGAHLCHIGGGEPVTLAFVMVDYVRHLKHHLAQILGNEALNPRVP